MQGLGKSLRRVATVAMTCILAVTTAGCGGGSGGSTVAPTRLNAVLSGTQEIPATTSTASGTATVEIAADRKTVVVNLTTSGLTGVTASHIHLGKAGVNGGIVLPLFTGTGSFPAILTRTLTSADFMPTEGAATFSEAVNAILSGNAYINVHTQANPNGEIRGQIGGVALAATLAGTQEVPATASTATGRAAVQLDATQSTIFVNLSTAGLSNVTASHIHFGKAGVNGGIIFPLYSSGTFPTKLTKTLNSADFVPDPGVATFSDAVNAILSGNTYINVHTSANPNGEIRGQLGAVALAATLAGTQEVPATASTATGKAAVQLDASQSTIFVNLSTAGLSNVTASHIHFGKTGVNGGIIFPLYTSAGTFPTKLTKTLSSADFVPDPGVATFSDAVNAILSGNTYINVHTQTNPDGDIRGQVGPARFTATLTGAQEVPASGSPATGTATVQFDATQTAMEVNMLSQGFTSTVTASHIHFGAAGTNGGIMFPLFAGPGQFPSPLTKALTSADFTPVPRSVATYPEAVNAILSGNAYINIHTQANPDGDIRGQLTPQ